MGPTLTKAQIDAALVYGANHQRERTQGLQLVDVAARIAASDGLASQGFSVKLFTPTTWVRERAAVAARAGRVLTRTEITEADTLPVMRAVVYPDIPAYVNAGWQGVSSVQTVSLANHAGRAILPLAQKVFEMPLIHTETRATISGFMGLHAIFALDDVQSMRGGTLGEYFVRIVGTSGEVKRFKVKRKHFASLP
jgi:hypothetical protein